MRLGGYADCTPPVKKIKKDAIVSSFFIYICNRNVNI